MTVLRLLAGERGYAQLEPADVRDALGRELGERNPDTALFRQFPEPQPALNRLAAERFLRGDKAYAPPPPPPLRVEDSEDDEEPASEPARREISSSHFALEVQADAAPTRQCPYCGGVLPAHHKVNFCPHCGQPPSGELKCPACGSEVDVGWAYCVSCGRATGFEGGATQSLSSRGTASDPRSSRRRSRCWIARPPSTASAWTSNGCRTPPLTISRRGRRSRRRRSAICATTWTPSSWARSAIHAFRGTSTHATSCWACDSGSTST